MITERAARKSYVHVEENANVMCAALDWLINKLTEKSNFKSCPEKENITTSIAHLRLLHGAACFWGRVTVAMHISEVTMAHHVWWGNHGGVTMAHHVWWGNHGTSCLVG